MDDTTGGLAASVDRRALVSRADLEYDAPPERSEAGVPVGNGRTGTLVWTRPGALQFQMNRADVYASGGASESFDRRHQDYAYGCGRVDVELVRAGVDAFPEDDTRLHLSVYDGRATVEGDGVTATVYACPERDVLVVEVETERTDPEPVAAVLRSLRPAVVETKHHTATSEPAVAGEGRATLTQTFEEGEYHCHSAVAVGVADRAARAERTTDTEARVAVEAQTPADEQVSAEEQAPAEAVTTGETGSVTVLVATAASFDPDDDVTAMAVDELEAAAAAGVDELAAESEAWWHEFWTRSFVHVEGRDDRDADDEGRDGGGGDEEGGDGDAALVEASYTYFHYLMASSSRGAYPPNYGGMLWLSEGDDRRWGAQQWWTNLSLYYRGLFPADRDELTDPIFDMYSKMVDACALAARQQWGSEGVYVPETTFFDGLPELPEDVAAEMRDLYLLEKPWERRSERFREFARSKHGHTSRWNWKDAGRWEAGRWTYGDKGDGPYGATNYLFATTAEVAGLYWRRYEYTGDEAWLRERAYPMLRGAAEFFRNYPNLERDSTGTWHLHHVNHGEGVKGARNPFDAMAGLRGVLPLAIEAARRLGEDAELRAEWRALLDDLAPLPASDHPDALASTDPDESPVWVAGLHPVVRAFGDGHLSDIRTRFFDFDLATLEARDQRSDGDSRFDRAAATYDRRYPDGITDETRVRVMASTPAEAARLGRAEDVGTALVNQLRAPWPDEDFVEYDATGDPAVLPNRMTLREGYNALGAQRLGNAAYGVHEGLCQSVPSEPGGDPVIRVFPAWPERWDATFDLRCRGGVHVTAARRDGEVQFVELDAPEDGGEYQLRNPWDGDVDAHRSGGDGNRDGTGNRDRYGNRDRDGSTETLEGAAGSLLAVDLDADERVVIVPAGASPAERTVTVAPSADAD